MHDDFEQCCNIVPRKQGGRVMCLALRFPWDRQTDRYPVQLIFETVFCVLRLLRYLLSRVYRNFNTGIASLLCAAFSVSPCAVCCAAGNRRLIKEKGINRHLVLHSSFVFGAGIDLPICLRYCCLRFLQSRRGVRSNRRSNCIPDI